MIVVLLTFTSVSAVSGESSGVTAPDITYTVGANSIEIQSQNVTMLISKTIPAASARTGGQADSTGDGFVLRSFVGYNKSEGTGFSPDTIEFRAPTNRSTWTVLGPQINTTSAGKVVTTELRATLDMVRVGMNGNGSGGPGGGAEMVIQDWALVTIRFIVSNFNYSASYEGVANPSDYDINGSSELKFDVSLELLRPLDVDSLAMELALEKMDDGMFSPSTTSGHYGFRGYQSGGMVSESDPSVNETDGSALVTHRFESRNQFEQLIDFVNGTGAADGYLTWASQAKIGGIGSSQLGEVSAFYRTDGEALTVYLSTSLTADTVTIDHDPSIGVFSTVSLPILLPDTTPLGESILWITVGIMVGLASAGGAGMYVLYSRSPDQDPSDSVDLGKNRYFRGKL